MFEIRENNFQKTNNILGAFCRLKQAAKPGYPFQFLDFAYAKSAGFPLLSLALLFACGK